MKVVVWSSTANREESIIGRQLRQLRHAHLSNVRFPLAFKSRPGSWRGSRTPGTRPPRYHSRWRWSARLAAGVRAESSWCTVDGRPGTRRSASRRGDGGDTRPLVDVSSCWSSGKLACISSRTKHVYKAEILHSVQPVCSVCCVHHVLKWLQSASRKM